MEYKVIYKNLKPLLCINKKEFIGYSKGSLYICNLDKTKKEYICTINDGIVNKFFSKIRFTERMFRLVPRFAVPLDKENFLLSYHGKMLRVSLENKEKYLECQYTKGMNNPLNYCVVDSIPGFNDTILFGEYTGNPEKKEVSIYARTNGEWQIIYSFKKGMINHIHAIIPDINRKGVLILTGDDDESSGIWLAKDNFNFVKPLLLGKQIYRSCVAFPDESGIYYLTDTPLEKNYLVHAEESNNKWKIQIIQEIKGSVIHAIRIGSKIIFSTTVEPDSRIKGIKYLFTNKLGEGILTRYCYVNEIENDKIVEICRFEKDKLPMALCQFGNVEYITVSDNNLLMHPVAVKKYENDCLSIMR